MLIVCPSCASSYSLTPEQLGEGRNLRCASCRTTWFARAQDALSEMELEASPPETTVAPISPQAQTPDEAEGATREAPAAIDVKEPPAKPRASRSDRRKPKAPRRAWPRLTAPRLAALALVALVGGGLAFRYPIVRHFPQMAGLYAALGLKVNLRGLEIVELRSELDADDKGAELVISGQVRGVAAGPQPVPHIRINVRGKGGENMFTWTSPLARATLNRGETVAFQKHLLNPPADVRDVLVHFVDDEPVAARKKP